MFNSNVIDVAIGLVFVFLLLSLIASAAKELFEALAKRRAKDLERGIQELLGSDSKDFLARLYDHGLINSLFKGKYGSIDNGDLPSYIPAKNFALALMDLRKQCENSDAGTPEITLPLHVKQAFDAFKISAGDDAAKLQQNVEDWYNSSMDRVSGWYKRRSQWWVFGIGLVFTVVVNVDCIVIAKRLSIDATLRQAVVRAAEQEVKNPTAGVAASQNPATPANSNEAIATTDDKAAKGDATVEQSITKIKAHLSELDGVGLPLGWQNDEQKNLKGVLAHIPGWLLTALAVSLGAPFWFDMLNKIMVVRSTVKPHEKSKEEGSKEPGASKLTPASSKS